jgi:hypothetical protein
MLMHRWRVRETARWTSRGGGGGGGDGTVDGGLLARLSVGDGGGSLLSLLLLSLVVRLLLSVGVGLSLSLRGLLLLNLLLLLLLLRLKSVPLLLREVLLVLLRVVRPSRLCRPGSGRKTAIRLRGGSGSGGAGGGGRGRRAGLGGSGGGVTRRRDEGSKEGLAEDEGVEASLLRGPALIGVEVEKSLDEVDEGDAVAHFCA